MPRKKILSSLMLVLIAAAGLTVPARASVPGCTSTHDNDAAPKTQDLAPDLAGPGGVPLIGHYTLPATSAPTDLVVFFHGYQNRSNSWVCHLQDASVNHNAVAVALDYRGTGWTGAPADNRGWFVQEGADDSIVAAKYFLARFPSITRVTALGISMGGNSSGLAVAAGAHRANGAPLFDYWIDIEGVANLIEEYVLATAATPASATAAWAAADIEKECGGTIVAALSCYQSLTLTTRVPDIAASGVKGVVVVHGVDDGLVPTNQSREISTLLRLAGVPTDQYTVLRRNDGDPGEQGGTTATGIVGDPLFAGLGMTYPAPFAGHGWEGSDTQLVIATGFAAMWRTLETSGSAPANHEFLVDSGIASGAPQKLI
jgi:hypothetical protein